jgi:TetR/AcrR family transcriptional regulator, hemagglutinin/protease regulatory protein
MRVRAARLAPDARRAQLLQCATRVFARRGLARGGHAEVAEEAAVAVPTVFSYFRTRSDLLAAVLERVARHYSEMADRHYRPENPAPRALLDFAIAFAASVDTHRDLAIVLLDWSTAVRSEIWPLFLEFHRSMVARIEGTIRRGQAAGQIAADVDANDAALVIIGSAHLVVQMKFSHTEPERVHRFLLALLRAAIGAVPVAAALAGAAASPPPAVAPAQRDG